jgi:Xaa-Pro aminopeptidase
MISMEGFTDQIKDVLCNAVKNQIEIKLTEAAQEIKEKAHNEIESKISDIIAQVAVRVSRQMSLETLSDRMIITVHKEGMQQ